MVWEDIGSREEIDVYSSPLFRDLTLEELAELFRTARYFIREKGELIFQEGMPAEGLYLICYGKVKLVHQTPDRHKKQVLKILGPGEILGGEAFFTRSAHEVYARALEKTRLCFFARDDFLGFLKGHPALALKILEVLSRELKRLQSQLLELAYACAEERLAHLLLRLAYRYGVKSGEALVLDLGLSRAELAELVGLRPETIIRILKRWQTEGILAVQGRRLVLLDKDRLAALRKVITYAPQEDHPPEVGSELTSSLC